MLGMRLCVLHNLYFYNTMMEEIREALDEGRFGEYKRRTAIFFFSLLCGLNKKNHIAKIRTP